jgi:GNAT superfamily N-acetyltransferase
VQRQIGGWVAQFAYGHTRRANSVTALGWDAADDMEARIDEVEAFYARHAQPAVFRLTRFSAPEALDAALDRRGYERRAGALVLRRALDPAEPLLAAAPEPEDLPLDAWIAEFARLHGSDPAQHTAHRAIIEAIEAPRLCAALPESGAPERSAACAIAVHDTGCVGIFDVVTAEALRGQGYGRRLMLGILAWGARRGARLAYLQVVETNMPARRLYDALGFQEAYRYWYRVRI